MKRVIISLILSLILALLAFFKKAMTNHALITAFIFAFLITYFGAKYGIACLLILATVFIGVLISSQIHKQKRNQINEAVIAKSHKKDIFQILANVSVGTLSIILFAITKNQKFIVIYAAVMAESLSDSLASDIGVLSKKQPFNILTLKPSTPGISGNISLLGLIASLLGSSIIGLIYFLCIKKSIINFLIISIFGLLGALIDSILGATIQVKYECIVCNKEVEQKYHCQKNTKYKKGIPKFNNDCINFISNLAVFLILALILK